MHLNAIKCGVLHPETKVAVRRMMVNNHLNPGVADIIMAKRTNANVAGQTENRAKIYTVSQDVIISVVS